VELELWEAFQLKAMITAVRVVKVETDTAVEYI
jgi:hypothetical protein